jgi:hypothetical protein
MTHTEQMREIIVDVWDRTKAIDEAVEEIAALTAPALDAGVVRAMADEMDAAAQAAPVAIYQCQGVDGMWQDMNKVCHDEYVKLGGGPARVVYTTPPAAQPAPVQEPVPLNASHIDSLIESAIQGHAGTRDAMRWLVRQLATKPEPMTDEQADYLIGDLSEWSGYVEVDTAPRTLEKHVREVLAKHGITKEQA